MARKRQAFMAAIKRANEKRKRQRQALAKLVKEQAGQPLQWVKGKLGYTLLSLFRLRKCRLWGQPVWVLEERSADKAGGWQQADISKTAFVTLREGKAKAEAHALELLDS